MDGLLPTACMLHADWQRGECIVLLCGYCDNDVSIVGRHRLRAVDQHSVAILECEPHLRRRCWRLPRRMKSEHMLRCELGNMLCCEVETAMPLGRKKVAVNWPSTRAI